MQSATQKIAPLRLALLSAVLTLFFFSWSTLHTSVGTTFVEGMKRQRQHVSPRQHAANTTLGFEKILAVSLKPSWRTRGLFAAADKTGLSIEAPKQPYNSDELAHAFSEVGTEKPDVHQPNYGSTKAWLAHLDINKHFIMSVLSTALIIEEDVDWDLTIKNQMQLVSDNIRNFSNIGHCGSVTDEHTEKREYIDPSMDQHKLYTGWAKYSFQHIQEGHRAIQHIQQTICTFGYAITQRGAHDILRILNKGQEEAYDLGLSSACARGDLNCLTVNPELMHHYSPLLRAGYISPNREGQGQGKSTAEETFENTKGSSGNIKDSARCDTLFHDTCRQTHDNLEDQ